MIYVPGKFIFVNKIPSLLKFILQKNERLICFFDIARVISIAVIMVGAVCFWHNYDGKEDCFNKKYKNFLYPSIGKESVFIKKEIVIDVLCWGQLL